MFVMRKFFARLCGAGKPDPSSETEQPARPYRGHEALDEDWTERNIAAIRSQLGANIKLHEIVKERVDAFVANGCSGTGEDAALAISYFHAKGIVGGEPVSLLKDIDAVLREEFGVDGSVLCLKGLAYKAFEASRPFGLVGMGAPRDMCVWSFGVLGEYAASFRNAGLAATTLATGSLAYANHYRWQELPFTISRRSAAGLVVA